MGGIVKKSAIFVISAFLAAGLAAGVPPAATFDFADGTVQGFSMDGALGKGMAASAAKPLLGKYSLAVDLESSAQGQSQVVLKVNRGLEKVGDGSTVTFHVWIPAVSSFTGFEPYETDGNGGWDGKWTGDFIPGKWNTFEYRVSCGATTPLKEIGLFLFATGPVKTRVYLADVTATSGSKGAHPRPKPKYLKLTPIAQLLKWFFEGEAYAADGHEKPQINQGPQNEQLLAPPPGVQAQGVQLRTPSAEDLKRLDEFEEGPLGVQGTGNILVPTSQLLTPAGQSVTFSGRPVDLAFSPDGKTLAVLNMADITFIDVKKAKIKKTLSLQSAEADCENEAREGSFGGILYGADGTLYYSTVQGLGVYRQGKRSLVPMEIPCGLAFSPDKKSLYVAINGKDQLGVVDLKTLELREVMDVGVAPFGIAVGKDGRIFVSNWGGHMSGGSQASAATYNSRALIDKNGAANDGTVSVVDLAQANIRTIPVGKLPCGLALSKDGQRLYVANANSDTVSVVDTEANQVVQTLGTRPAALPFGSAPQALALSGDGRKLYITNAGNNAIAEVELASGEVIGMIPTAWYPGAVSLRDGLLAVANIKGYGALAGPAGKRDIHEYLGSVSLIPVPGSGGLKTMTSQVDQNNRLARALAELRPPRKDAKPVALPERHGEPSLIKHVLYIIKENKTYDGVFGDLSEGEGDPSLCMFCDDTPNEHKLAKEFVLLDHFYCSGTLSADGHQWTDEAYVTAYLEKSFGGFPRSYPSEGQDALALAPSGFLWSNAVSHGLTFRNYGEMCKATLVPENATWRDYWSDYQHGTHKVGLKVEANVGPLNPYTCPAYPGWPMTIPDVAKARTFIEELKGFEKKGQMPAFMTMCLPNDHTGGTGPGSPTPKAQVADNDLALGQIVEAVTHSKFWKETAILVVEDDSQGMPDHVDAHRSPAMVISPYTRRHSVVRTNYTQCGMAKTIELLLGLPPMNQFDLAATPLRGCFDGALDTGGYTAAPSAVPLDSMNLSLDQLGPKARYWAEQSMQIPMTEPGRDEKQDRIFSEILWHATRGYDTPYPHSRADETEDE
jgi:YVTN family beta-propeller protein